MTFPRENLSLRQKCCFTIAILLVCIGLFQFVTSIYTLFIAGGEKCQGSRGLAIGAYLLMAGISGAVGYFPRRTTSHCKQIQIYGRSNLSGVVVFVISCALLAVFVVVDKDVLGCNFTGFGSGILYLQDVLILLMKIVLHIAHLLCGLGVGLAVPDLLFKDQASKQYSPPADDESSFKLIKTTKSNPKIKSCQALRLPEARTHVQEVPGTDEKVTVITLPKAEGIIYAVPEEQYAIRRGEAMYLAPAGNTRLAAIFPTYTRIQRE